jgi:cytochrome c
MIKRVLLLMLVLGTVQVQAQAETPQQILDGLVAQAGPASAARGEKLFRSKFSGGKNADSCTSCHTENAKAVGSHVKTNKVIDPLAPVVQKDRFTDPAKVEKWFKRNCNDVLGRACSAQEKADFTAYMISIK